MYSDQLLGARHALIYLIMIMEKMLLYWSEDQCNNVQKFVERKGGAMLPDGRKELILHQFKRTEN